MNKMINEFKLLKNNISNNNLKNNNVSHQTITYNNGEKYIKEKLKME